MPPGVLPRPSTLLRCRQLAATWWRLAFTLDTRGLAAFRIGLGLTLVADCILRFRTFPLMFAVDGVFPPDLLRAYQGTAAAWSIVLASDATSWAGAVLAMEGVLGGLLALGLHTRLVTIAAWVVTISIVHRTAPATYAGDMWLLCMLLWSIFLPLGGVWSLDAVRRSPRQRPTAALSIATAALVMQTAVVYLGAGLSKFNPVWLSGEAAAYALSVHDHGNPLGMLIARVNWLTAAATWTVLAVELIAPLALVFVPAVRVRIVLATIFILFHLAVGATMWVDLFPMIGITAWLALIPRPVWDLVAPHRAEIPRMAVLGRGAALACGAALAISAVSLVHAWGLLGPAPLPRPIRDAIAATGLVQEWSMFGEVPAQEQWVYGRAVLADGRIVDLLRGGRPLEAERPSGGFGSLGSHRWHKLFWIMPRPNVRPFGPPTAAAFAAAWNARHGSDEQVRSLELRFATQGVASFEAPVRDMLVAAWPPRGRDGEGSLDRLLDAAALPPAPREMDHQPREARGAPRVD
jgi:hypothetical protein